VIPGLVQAIRVADNTETRHRAMQRLVTYFYSACLDSDSMILLFAIQASNQPLCQHWAIHYPNIYLVENPGYVLWITE